MKQLFIVSTSENECVTHDGYIQIGIFNHSVEKHLELNPTINWQETYWMPDPFCIRYKRINYQHTMKANEGSPRTDNAGQGSAEFGSKPKGCNKLEDK